MHQSRGIPLGQRRDRNEGFDGELGDVLVIMSGYNDPRNTIDDAIEAVVDEARDQGIGHVVWLSLRTGSDVEYSDPQQQSSVDTFREYNRQLHEAAATSAGYLQFADWAGYSAGSDGWFEYDGVHLTARGVDRLTEYLAGIVGRVLAGQNVTPADPPWTVLVPGAEGDIITDVQEALMASGIELTGGADGVYGDATMVAVAAYQRQREDLSVTGAVDLATARALGVVEDPNTIAPSTTAATATTIAVPTNTVRPAPSITVNDGAASNVTAVTVAAGVLTGALHWPCLPAAATSGADGEPVAGPGCTLPLPQVAASPTSAGRSIAASLHHLRLRPRGPDPHGARARGRVTNLAGRWDEIVTVPRRVPRYSGQELRLERTRVR